MKLKFTSGELSGRVLDFDEDLISIGRSRNARIRLSDPKISGVHAQVINHNQHFYIVDNNSFNGTAVNGMKIAEKTEIFIGDVIKIGKTEFVLYQETVIPYKARSKSNRNIILLFLIEPLQLLIEHSYQKETTCR